MAETTKPKKNKGGRPPGSKTQPAPLAQGRLTRCIRPECRSTEREPYSDVTRRAIVGVDPVTGDPYTHVVWRTTRCKACGQKRRDRHFENNITAAAA